MELRHVAITECLPNWRDAAFFMFCNEMRNFGEGMVQIESTYSVNQTTLGFWASVGIAKGKTFAPDERMKKILIEAAGVRDATARAIMYRWQTPDGYYYPNSAWRSGFIGGYKFEENGARLLNTYSGFFFY